jgi:hypothetical protein
MPRSRTGFRFLAELSLVQGDFADGTVNAGLLKQVMARGLRCAAGCINTGASYMNDQIVIPDCEEIATMSSPRLQRERLRLRNEVSFARSDALGGGPSADEMLRALRAALKAIEARLLQLGNGTESTLGVC